MERYDNEESLSVSSEVMTSSAARGILNYASFFLVFHCTGNFSIIETSPL